jgi:hypothetical protein
VTLSGTAQAIVGFALRQAYILLSGASGQARGNLVGMTATGSSADNSAAAYGIAFSASGATIRNNFVTVNNSAIRSDGGATGSVITLNEVARPSFGHDNTFDGILLINGASTVTIANNLVRDQRGGGIELGFGAATDAYTNITGLEQHRAEQRLRFGLDAVDRATRYDRLQLHRQQRRVLPQPRAQQRRPGMVLLGATGTILSQNSFSGNGGVTAVSGLAIDLDPNTRDPNALNTAERRDDQRRERRGHRAERPAELTRSSLRQSLRTASCRSPASRGPAARWSCTWRRRIRAASAKAHLFDDADRRRGVGSERDDRHLRPGCDQRPSARAPTRRIASHSGWRSRAA